MTTQENDSPKRPIKQALLRGITCKCPACGKASIFDGPLSVKQLCEVCGENLSHHQADDLPAYLNIFIVGHVVIGFSMAMMRYKYFDLWTTTFLTAAMCIIVGLALMRPLKGMVVASQWALGMHGFDKNSSKLS